MERRSSVVVLIAVLFTPALVTGATIRVDSSLVTGDTLRITCDESSLGSLEIQSLGLQRARNGQYQDVVSYGYSRVSGEFVPTWAPEESSLQQRLNVTYKNFGTSTGRIEFALPNVQCSDTNSFRCRSTDTGGKAYVSPEGNVTVQGVTQYLEISGPADCETYIDQACDQCVNFDDPNGPTPKYVKMGQVQELTCSGDLAMPASANTFRWYKLTKNSFSEVQIMDNVTHNIPDTVPDNSCTVRGSSTLRYYPQPTDEELRIYCDLTYRVTTSRTQRANMSICVEGLIAAPTPGPRDPPASTAGLGAGPIAGIVIGVIAAIVLVVVLVYFLWYRRRDSGESYSTREADGRTAPPVAKKPEMHENSNYDTTGDSQDNNHYGRRYSPGKVNQGMEDDYYHHDNDTAPRSRDPIGSSV